MGDEKGREEQRVILQLAQLQVSGTSTGGTQTNENACGFDDEEEEQLLLPGLFDDVTLNYVVPRLHWTAFHILALVSRSWLQAIRSRRVYDARVRSNSTETLFVSLVWSPDPISSCGNKIALYSMRDKRCYQLLHFPQHDCFGLFISHDFLVRRCQGHSNA